jgi:hypothetical protein
MSRNIAFLVVSILSIQLSFSQKISVSSFKLLETDMDAKQNFPERDQNGNLCAIIKVVTTQTGFDFDNGTLGITKVKQQKGEIWIYVPYGTKYLTIQHAQLGLLRNYQIPISVEQGRVYEMFITSAKVKTIIEDEGIQAQYFVITANPSDAILTVTNEQTQAQYEATGEFQKKLPPGKYSWRAEAPMYYNSAGTVNLTMAQRENVTAELKPNFGFASISVTPEEGATVTVDDNKTNLVTPCTTEKLKSGEHTVTLTKDMYRTKKEKFTVNDGQTTPLTITLQANFAVLNITAPAEADILINNQVKGKGSQNIRLDAGVYNLEARIDKHYPAKQDVELMAGDKKDITLEPQPITGTLDVLTKPSGATITLNGKDYGTTPNTINKLLIGDYSLTIDKKGFNKLDKSITIQEGVTTETNEILVKIGSTAITTASANTKTQASKPAITQPVPATNAKEVMPEKSTPSLGGKRVLMWTFIGASGLCLAKSLGDIINANSEYDNYQAATDETTAGDLHKSVQDYQKKAMIFASAGVFTATCAILLKRKINKLKLTGYYTPESGGNLMMTYNF